MKVIEINAFGPAAETVQCVEVDGPGAPSDAEVVVEVEAFPINPADLLLIEGKYAEQPPLPARLGAECVGRVIAAGSAVEEVAIGDRVIVLARDNWASHRKVDWRGVLKIDDGADVLQTAMLKVNPATALMMLRDYVALQPGDWVIQDAANSGVGRALISLAIADGIKTVNVVRRPELIGELTALGGDAVVVDGDDLAARVHEIVGDGQIKLGIDAVTGPVCIRMTDCLAEGATLVNYGLLSGDPIVLRADQVVFKGIEVKGFWLAKAMRSLSREDLRSLYDVLIGRVKSGQLHVPVDATFAIEEIKNAAARAGESGRNGKVLVLPNGLID